MKKKYHREVSPIEKIYLSKEYRRQHFTNQGVLEGTGSFNLVEWQKAVNAATSVNSGSRVILNKRGRKSYWTEGGISPRVRLITDCDWDGQNSKGIRYLPDQLCPINGPVCEIILLDCRDKQRVVINTLHAVMDGIGTVTWGMDIFRALRGEPLVGSTQTVTDIDISKRFKVIAKPKLHKKCISPFTPICPQRQGGIWIRKQVPWISSRIIPKICKTLVAETCRLKDGGVRIMIPVNLRRRKKNLFSTGNLTGNVFLDLSKGDSERDIYTKFIRQLRNYADCYFPFGLKMMKYIPIRVIQNSIYKKDEKCLQTGRYPFTGVVTHLGRLTKGQMDTGSFKGDSWFSVNSMSGPGLPSIFIAVSEFVSENDRHSNLVFGAPRTLANYEDIELISRRFVRAITKSCT